MDKNLTLYEQHFPLSVLYIEVSHKTAFEKKELLLKIFVCHQVKEIFVPIGDFCYSSIMSQHRTEKKAKE